MTLWHAIDCINRNDEHHPYARITHVGGVGRGGHRWRITMAQAVHGIATGMWRLYVEQPGGVVMPVVVAVSRFGNTYLKAEVDGDEPQTLLSLPDCDPAIDIVLPAVV